MLSKYPLAVPLGTAAFVFEAQAINDLGLTILAIALAVVVALLLIILVLLALDRDASLRSRGPRGTTTHTLTFPKRPPKR